MKSKSTPCSWSDPDLVVAQRARFYVEERRDGSDDGALGHRAQFELPVRARGLADLDLDDLDHGRLKTLERDGHAIGAGIERCHDVVAALARDRGDRQT